MWAFVGHPYRGCSVGHVLTCFFQMADLSPPGERSGDPWTEAPRYPQVHDMGLTSVI